MEEKKRHRAGLDVGAPLSGSSLVGMVLISSCVLVVGLEEKKLEKRESEKTWKKERGV